MTGGGPRRTGRGARVVARLAAVALGLALGAVVGEAAARVAVAFGVAPDLGGDALVRPEGHPFHPERGLYLIDGEEGFRPAPTNPEYGPHGALVNDHPLERTPGVPRVLCLGDSVTHRARIVTALEERAPGVEWWNAGVEGWATRQEAAYLERIGPGIDPDLVLLFLHLNDFTVTPVQFFDAEGRLVQFTPHSPRSLSPWLLERSALYRAWVGWSAEPADANRLAAEVLGALERMRAECERRGFAFAVAVLPVFAPPDTEPAEDWAAIFATAEERRARVLAWTAAAGVPAWSLRDPVRATAAAGEPVWQNPFDAQHPSTEAGDACAAYLLEQGLLELLPGGGG